MSLQIPTDAVDLEAIEAGDTSALADTIKTLLNSINGLLQRPQETGKWTDYTPTWTSNSGGTGSAGTGEYQGRYSIVGNLLFFTIRMVWGASGASSPHATADWQFSLPVPVRGSVAASGLCEDVSAGSKFTLIARMAPSSELNIQFLIPSEGDTIVDMLQPMSISSADWDPGDYFEIAGMAEIKV